MKPLTLILTWLLFCGSYIALSFVIFFVFPEIWLWEALRENHDNITEPLWESIIMSSVFTLSFIANVIFIFATLTTLNKLTTIKIFQDKHKQAITPLRAALTWGVFFASFIALTFLIDAYTAETWLLEALGEKNPNTEQPVRSLPYELTIILLALITNISFMLVLLTHLNRTYKQSEVCR